MSLLSSLLQLGKVYGIESHVLSPAETKDLYPLMNVDDLYGTLYVPKDGTMDPAGTCTTLTRAASARGATVRYTHTHKHTRIHTHTHINTHTHAQTHTHINTHTHTHT